MDKKNKAQNRVPAKQNRVPAESCSREFSLRERAVNLLRELWFPRVPAHIKRGRAGEDFAAKFLKKEGYKILLRNVKIDGDELDIVAMEPGETLVFVEVKTRSDRDLRGGFAAVDSRKRQALSRIIRSYLRRAYWTKKPWRFDIVEVIVADSVDGAYSAKHLKGASLWKKY